MRNYFKKASTEPTAGDKVALDVKRAEAERLIFEKHGIDIGAIHREAIARFQPTRAIRLSTVWGGVAVGALLGGAHVATAVALATFVNAIAVVLIREWGSEQPRMTKRMLLAQTGSLGVAFGAMGAAAFHFLATHR